MGIPTSKRLRKAYDFQEVRSEVHVSSAGLLFFSAVDLRVARMMPAVSV
jgi:hypothetical protein